MALVMTWYYNLQFMADSGGSFDIAAFVAAGATNAAAKSLSWDLFIACIAGLTPLRLASADSLSLHQPDTAPSLFARTR